MGNPGHCTLIAARENPGTWEPDLKGKLKRKIPATVSGQYLYRNTVTGKFMSANGPWNEESKQFNVSEFEGLRLSPPQNL